MNYDEDFEEQEDCETYDDTDTGDEEIEAELQRPVDDERLRRLFVVRRRAK
jgi:hypothetical protein